MDHSDMLGQHLPYYCELCFHSALRNIVIAEKTATNVKQGANNRHSCLHMQL